jgi:PAS domain S-box-containing protein
MAVDRSAVRQFAFPVSILAIGLATTVGISLQMKRAADEQDRERFGVAVDHFHDSVATRMDTYVAMLLAGAGLMAGGEDVTPEEFRAFVARLDVQQRYPGIQGIGFTERIPPERLARITALQEARGFDRFAVWPATPRDEYHAILYLEPLDHRNRAAIGFDMFTEATRREAMSRARDTGQPAASGPVTLVQEIDQDKQAGFLIYAPVYTPGPPPDTVEDRRARLHGFVYSPFRAGDLFLGLLGRNPRPRAAFTLYDGEPAADSLLHRVAVEGHAPRFTATRRIGVAGREWTARITSTPALDESSGGRFVPIVIWGGLGVSLLLTAVATRESLARIQAERAEAEAAAASDRFRQLANSIPQLAWTARPDGAIDWYNDRWYAYTGTTFEEMQGWGWQTVHDPAMLPRVLEAWRVSLESGEPFEMEFPLRGADGRVRMFLTRIRPVRNAQGEIVQWFGTNTDVQYRLDAEAALQQQAETLEIVHRSGMQLAAELDLERLVQAVTDTATRLTRAQFGAFFYNALDARDESYALYALSGVGREAFAGFPTPRDTRLFGPTFRGEGIIRSDDITADDRYGRNPPYHGMPEGHPPVRSYLAVPVRSRSGDVLGCLFFGHPDAGIFTPQAEHIAGGIAAQAATAIDNARLYGRVQELLESERTARAQAERDSRLKDEFLATLSHELRTPLNAVVGWAHLLDQGSLTEDQQRRAVDTILRNARVQTQLIEDLLDMSRIVSGRLTLDMSTLDVRDVVEESVNVVRPTADASKLEMTVCALPQPYPAVGDANRLRQVVWNLLTNAVKFTPPGGHVTVTLTARADHIVLTVSDTGIGIDPAFLPHVFDRFRQADGSATRSHGGLGLGLSIVRNLVEMHAGEVHVMSDGPGTGATFTVTLPRAATALSGERTHAGDARRVLPNRSDRLNGLHILVVDDDADAREVAGEVLARHGAIVSTAMSGAEALRTIEVSPPDVIVSDIGMPHLDGYTLMRRVRAHADPRAARAHAVALTAYASAGDRERATAAGYDVHLSKPFSPGDLVEACAPADERHAG